MSVRAVSILALAVAACAASVDDGPRLDPRRLPPELRGLVPGVATEPELAAALPDATATRDQLYGGSREVRLSGEPAIQVQSTTAGLEAWLIRIAGQPRIGSLFVRLDRPCAEAMTEWGGRLRRGACVDSGVARAPNQHDFCAATPDGRYPVDVSCFDAVPGHPGRISAFVLAVPARAREYRIAPARDAQ